MQPPGWPHLNAVAKRRPSGFGSGAGLTTGKPLARCSAFSGPASICSNYTVLFAFITLAAAVTLVVRFFSQDWAGAKIRYEERRMHDEERKRKG